MWTERQTRNLKKAFRQWAAAVVATALLVLAQSGWVQASESVLIKSEVIHQTPLAAARPPGAFSGGQQFASAASISALQMPTGDIAGFGAAVVWFTTGNFDFVVVGAPNAGSGRGRAFVYRKAWDGNAFGAPVELGHPGVTAGARFGTSVAGRQGLIVIGAPGVNRIFAFSQNRDEYGLPLDSEAFQSDHQQPQTTFGSGGVGDSMHLGSAEGDALLACHGSVCETFYQNWQQHPGYTSYRWTVSVVFGGMARGYISATSLAAIGTNGTFRIHNKDFSSGSNIYLNTTPDYVFGTPNGQGSFSGSIAGFFETYLAGVSVPPNGTRFYAYAPLTPLAVDWARQPVGGPPVITVPESLVGTTAVDLGDTWLVSNTNAAGTAAESGVIYRAKLFRGGTYYNHNDDAWTQEKLAAGGSKFGAALAIAPGYFMIGDPGVNQVVAVGNDQQFLRNTYTSDGTGSVKVTLTSVSGSAPPTIRENVNCSNVPGGIFQPSRFAGPCVDVTPNAPLIGSATVCYQVTGSSNRVLSVIRCSSPVPTSPPSCPGVERLFEGRCCTDLEAKRVDSYVCAETDHFSTIAVGEPLDTDGDFVPDVADNCRTTSNIQQQDQDSDSAGDTCDNCPLIANFDQSDNDHDGKGNACDTSPGAPVPLSRSVVSLFGACLIALGWVGLRRSRVRQWRR